MGYLIGPIINIKMQILHKRLSVNEEKIKPLANNTKKVKTVMCCITILTLIKLNFFC